MRDLVARLTLAAVLSTALGVLAAPSVAGVWGTLCSTTNGVCVWIDDNQTSSKATTGTTDNNYSGDVYPNTLTSINDTVSSVRNYFVSNDVTFHTGSSGGGSSFCQDSNTWDNDLGWLGGGYDDQLSSHAKVAGDGLC